MGVVRTGAAHLALPRTFPRHHADPGQPRGLPGEKGSVKVGEVGGVEAEPVLQELPGNDFAQRLVGQEGRNGRDRGLIAPVVGAGG